MNAHKAELLGHELQVEQDVEGGWRVRIAGERPVRYDFVLWSLTEAKSTVHSLAHWHLGKKTFCDCTRPLDWLPAENC